MTTFQLIALLLAAIWLLLVVIRFHRSRVVLIGGLVSRQGYYPYGGVRTDVGTVSQTNFGYTGQRNLDAQGNSYRLGLMDYKARFYDAYLHHFIQPDTLTAGGPQGLNRYSYALNNPSRFTDPTGHTACSAIPNAQARTYCKSQGGVLGFGIDTANDVKNKYFSQLTNAPTWNELSPGEKSLLIRDPDPGADWNEENWNAEVRGNSQNINGSVQDPALYFSIVVGGLASGLFKSLILFAGGAVCALNPQCEQESVQGILAAFPDAPSTLGHIFRDTPGHFLFDTFENRMIMLETVTSENLIKVSDYGYEIYSRLLGDGTEVWVYVMNGIIRNGGLNLIPEWH